MYEVTAFSVHFVRTAVLAVSADARADNGREHVLQRATDPVTGAQLTLSRRTDGLVAMDVRDKGAHLRKEVLETR